MKTTYIKTAAIMLLLLLLLFFACNWKQLIPTQIEPENLGKAIHLHQCGYKLCPYKNLPFFIKEPECVEGSDCYYLDKIHFENPGLSYDECESLLFGLPVNYYL